MRFHTASNGLIPLSEKTAPASPADVFFAGVERAAMRFEQFEIQVRPKDGVVEMRQDGLNGEAPAVIVLGLHQIPSFIAHLKAEVARAGEAK